MRKKGQKNQQSGNWVRQKYSILRLALPSLVPVFFMYKIKAIHTYVLGWLNEGSIHSGDVQIWSNETTVWSVYEVK